MSWRILKMNMAGALVPKAYRMDKHVSIVKIRDTLFREGWEENRVCPAWIPTPKETEQAAGPGDDGGFVTDAGEPNDGEEEYYPVEESGESSDEDEDVEMAEDFKDEMDLDLP